MKIARRKRLGWQLSIVVGLLGFSSVAAVGLLISRSNTEQLRENKGLAVAETAYQVADKLDRGMYERLRDMQVLSSLQTIRSTDATVAEKRALLDSLKASFPDYAFIGLTDKDGKVLASANGLLENAVVAARPWFIDTKARQKPTINDVHEALLLAKLLPNKTGEPLRFVDFSAPVFDKNNAFIGVLGSHLSFTWADDVRRSVLESAEQKDQVEVFILSSDDTVLLGPDGTQGKKLSLGGVNQAQSTGEYAEVTQSGKEYLVGYAQSNGYKEYEGFGWKVVARQPTTTAFAVAEQSRTTALQIAVLVGVLFALLSGVYLRRSLKREEELERAKDEFVSMVSHQLRTPLAAIRWQSEVTLDDTTQLSTDQRESLQEIHDSTVNMIALVNTMLNISRIEMGRLSVEPRPADITALVTAAIDEVRPLAAEKGVAIDADLQPVPETSVDSLLLSQVLHNLLTNAIRYSGTDKPAVRVGLRSSSDALLVEVADNGIGISKDAQKHLFERFYRAENAKKVAEDGTGLGLYLVRMILDQTGGQIAVESQEGKGTTFTVMLPLSGMRAKKGDRKLS